MQGIIDAVLAGHKKTPFGPLEAVRDVQAALGAVPPEASRRIARKLGLSAVDVEGVATFYHFFSASRPAAMRSISTPTSWPK